MKQLQPKRFRSFNAGLDYVNNSGLDLDNITILIMHDALIINSFIASKIIEYKEFASTFILTRECLIEHDLSRESISIEVFNR